MGEFFRVQFFPLGLSGVELAVFTILGVCLMLWGKGAVRAVGILIVLTLVIAWYPPLGLAIAVLVLVKLGVQSWIRRMISRPNAFAVAIMVGAIAGFFIGMYFLYR